jgi:methylenetetrahydrofolate reductase (NADPH)
MKIIEIYKRSNKPVFSFEFFPPKTEEGEDKLKETIKELKNWNPGFVSVTYGAGGSTRDKTIDICEQIQNAYNIVSMCHFTCVGVDRNEIFNTLKIIESKKIENVIALRGDPPKGDKKFSTHPNGFANSTELIQFIKQKGFSFGIAGGCYPEKHPDSPTLEDDINYLKYKTDAGAEFLITQLFFSNKIFSDFLNNVKSAGILTDIIPGIMPITSFSQIEKFKQLVDCYIPDELIEELEAVKDDQIEFTKRSNDFTTRQCLELLRMGVKGIHFYTLNQSRATIEIMKSLL